MPGAVYFVTTCLQGSVSETERSHLRSCRRRWVEAHNRDGKVAHEQVRRRYIDAFKAADEQWDRAPRVQWLAESALARGVRKSLYHFAGLRYSVLEYVVMPSHLHWVFQPTSEYEASFPDDDRTPREAILQSV